MAALRQVIRPPVDPATTAKLDAIYGDLARITALYAIGDVTKTITLADHVIVEARSTAYPPALAQALYWRGRAIADRDGGAEAESMFDQTFSAALSAGEDRLAADAAARLAQEALWAARLPDFERWRRVALALASRSRSVDITLFVDQLGCMSNHYTGKLRTRLACLRELSARRDKLGKPSEWLLTTLGLAATDAGELADSIHWLERGVELARAEHGADHPRTLEMRAYLCHGLNSVGDDTRGAAECRDALERLQKVAPDDRSLITRLQLYLADAELALHHPDRAAPLLEAAAGSTDDEVRLQAKAKLSALAGKRGDTTADVAQRRVSLAEAIKLFAPFNPLHPNITITRHELGVALLEHGDAAAALTELIKADTDAAAGELGPLAHAQIRFARSQAMVKAGTADHTAAHRLASEALELYVRHAPDTARFRTERTAIETWLATLVP